MALSAQSGPSTSGNSGRVTNVLVVEDDRLISTLLLDFLDMLGCQVHCAFNGREALDALEHLRPDLILLDLMMPVMSGREFGLALRADESRMHLPVVLMSAAGDVAAVCAEIDARSYLSKPFELDDLARELQRYR